MDRWLPTGFRIADYELGAVHAGNDKYQLYASGDRASKLLVVEQITGNRWATAGLLASNTLYSFQFGTKEYVCLAAGLEQLICETTKPPSSYAEDDIASFAHSLDRTRGALPDQDLGDALYFERYSVLLPLWALSEPVSDAELLGFWVSGGVRVSIHSHRRIKALAPWIDETKICELTRIAGLIGDAAPAEPDTISDTSSVTDAQQSIPRTPNSIRNEPVSFTLAGRPELETFFKEHVIDIVENAERYAALGIHFPSAIILHGPPGCGKTFAVERLLEYLDWPTFRIQASSVASPYIHETSKKVAEVFEQAVENAPSAIIIDEMEAFLPDRQGSAGSASHRVEEVSEFLRRIPEAIENRVFIAGMTNRLEMIDPAILRRGRFDHVIEVGMPSKEEVAALLESLLETLPTASNLDLGHVTHVLAGKAPSDIAFVVKEAGRLAARVGSLEIHQAQLEKAVEALPKEKKSETTRPIGFVWDRDEK
ncbi:ATP-binding protein [Salinisphaera sp. P385]|uniref:ATP-binding protein n=1 Tax=Spectribacter acetivorans TaxID=3075603 RepID=A0ABU3BD39_9GAMM|nr:ATP-binding protein [Salinisphaera sp. P385]MDT0619940.1 ATP-binding protein [Salinisphaera sp. P385]